MKKTIPIILSLIILSCATIPKSPNSYKQWGLHGTFDKLITHRDYGPDKIWDLYTSDALGFRELWISVTDSGALHAAKPFYTAVPADPNYHYDFELDDENNLVIKRQNMRYNKKLFFYRDLYDPEQDEYIVPIDDMMYDLDADGLTDYAEYSIFTDPYENDTDGDGLADGYDQNPLAAKNDTLNILQDLHKYIIERQLALYETKRLLIIEQFNNTPMEYERENGLLLSLSPAECDEYINTFGYGVPIMTASVKDTLGYYLVNYQLFIDPDTAFGFDALYDWSDSWKQWVRIQTLYDWESMP